MPDHIMIVDDEENVLKALKRELMDEDYEIHAYIDAREALQKLKNHPIKVVISDERMPGMSGSEFLSLVSLRSPDTVRIMLTGQATIEAAMQAVNRGEIYRFFTKPWNSAELKMSIRSAIDKYDLEKENRRLLAIVRNQKEKLGELEDRHPGISSLERDESGAVVIPEISEEEMESLRRELLKK